MENDDSDSRTRFYSAVIQLLEDGFSSVKMRILFAAVECTDEESLEFAYGILASTKPHDQAG